jgi:transglycosylase-like protein with SLT domain
VKLVAAGIAALLVAVLAVGAGTTVLSSHAVSPAAAADIPPDLLGLYTRAATYAHTQLRCPGIDWALLAAIGKVETDHGRSRLPGLTSGRNSAGAMGHMQLIERTFESVVAAHPPPPGGATPPSPFSAHDAVHAAAAYLCDNGAATGDLRAAVYAYNHSIDYVDQVFAHAAAYRATPPPTGGDGAARAAGAAATVTAWPAEQATLPDPSGTGGHVTPRTNSLYQALHQAGALTGGVTCWDAHLHNPTSDHPRGQACDAFFDPRDGNDVARGWRIASWLTTVQPTYGIRYLIWQGQIWTAEKPAWATYRSDIYNCPDPANITGCHYDHIHISMY